MADAWRKLARTVQENLVDACISEEAVELINLTVAKLQAMAEVLRAINNGANLEDAIDGYVEPDPVGVYPNAFLEDAQRQIKRHGSLHSLAVRVATLCGEHLHLVPDAQLTKLWESYNHTVLDKTTKAEMRLRNATVAYKAAKDAVTLAWVPPVGSLIWHVWILGAEQITTIAVDEATMAFRNVQEMRQALSMLVIIAEKILQLN